MNILEALNNKLSNYFRVSCYFIDFKSEVPIDVYYFGNEIMQGLYTSYLTFASNYIIDLDSEYKGTKIVSSFDRIYTGILLKDSELRKELLQVMLEYN